MKISIIIPCFNEVSTIEKIINKIKEEKKFLKEIIIIDDCSSDGTREILTTKLSNSIDHLILNEKNYGKGKSIILGIKEKISRKIFKSQNHSKTDLIN